MAKDELTVSVVGVGAKDCMVMRSLLNLANGRGSGPAWSLLEDGRGDVIVIDVDSETGQAEWPDMRAATNVIALSADKHFDAPAHLAKPLRAREFFAVLERVAGVSQPQVRAEVAKPAPVPPAAAAEPRKQPATIERGRTLADHLRLQTWSGPVLLSHEGWPMLPIDPGSGAWFFDGSISDLKPEQFARPIPGSAGVALSSAELVERVRGHRQRPLSELKWFAGLAQSAGKLHPDLKGDVQFMLVHAPAEAMENRTLHQLAQIVLRGPITLAQLIAESGEPEATVHAFLNACYASGKLLINSDWRAAAF